MGGRTDLPASPGVTDPALRPATRMPIALRADPGQLATSNIRRCPNSRAHHRLPSPAAHVPQVDIHYRAFLTGRPRSCTVPLLGQPGRCARNSHEPLIVGVPACYRLRSGFREEGDVRRRGRSKNQAHRFTPRPPAPGEPALRPPSRARSGFRRAGARGHRSAGCRRQRPHPLP